MGFKARKQAAAGGLLAAPTKQKTFGKAGRCGKVASAFPKMGFLRLVQFLTMS